MNVSRLGMFDVQLLWCRLASVYRIVSHCRKAQRDKIIGTGVFALINGPADGMSFRFLRRARVRNDAIFAVLLTALPSVQVVDYAGTSHFQTCGRLCGEDEGQRQLRPLPRLRAHLASQGNELT